MTVSTTKRRITQAIFVAAVTLLAACGTAREESPAVQSFKVAGAFIKNARAAKAAPKPTLSQLATIALNSKVQGPLMLATRQASDETGLLALLGTNGAYRTFTTPSRQNVTFKRGLISGTRGLGYDLMSAQLNPSMALVTSRKAGTAQRIHSYLTVESTERVLTFSCSISRGGTEALPKPQGGSVSSVTMIEQCTGDGQSFANQYWVLSDGYIWQSAQWVGPEYGTMVLQTLRR